MLLAYMRGGDAGYAPLSNARYGHGTIGEGVSQVVAYGGLASQFPGSATNQHVDWVKEVTPSVVSQSCIMGGWMTMVDPGATAVRWWNDRGTGATGTPGLAMLWNGSSYQYSTASQSAGEYVQFKNTDNDKSMFGKPCHFVLLWDQPAQDLSYWVDGVRVMTATQKIGTVTDVSTSRPWRLGAASNSTTTHRLKSAHLWNQYVFCGEGCSEEMVRRLYREPYFFLEEIGRTRFFAPAAAPQAAQEVLMMVA